MTRSTDIVAEAAAKIRANKCQWRIEDAKASLDELAFDLKGDDRERFWHVVAGHCMKQIRAISAAKPPSPIADYLPGGVSHAELAHEAAVDVEDARRAERELREADADHGRVRP